MAESDVGGRGAGEREPGLDPALALRWQLAYDALVRRATHEMNNALNAVAMNLEVARLRAVPGADAGRVAPFAAAAAESHEEVVAMVRAMTALARGPLGAACDLREVVEQVVALLAPGVRARGGSLVLAEGAAVRTAASAAAVRAAVADALVAATADSAAPLRCVVTRAGTTHGASTLAFEPPVAPRLEFPSG